LIVCEWLSDQCRGGFFDLDRRWRDGGPSLDGVPGMFPVARKDTEEEAI